MSVADERATRRLACASARTVSLHTRFTTPFYTKLIMSRTYLDALRGRDQSAQPNHYLCFAATLHAANPAPLLASTAVPAPAPPRADARQPHVTSEPHPVDHDGPVQRSAAPVPQPALTPSSASAPAVLLLLGLHGFIRRTRQRPQSLRIDRRRAGLHVLA